MSLPTRYEKRIWGLIALPKLTSRQSSLLHTQLYHKSIRQTPYHIRHRCHDEIRTALLVHLNLVFVDQHRHQNLGITRPFDGAIIHYGIQVVSGIAYVEAAADAAGDALDSQLQSA